MSIAHKREDAVGAAQEDATNVYMPLCHEPLVHDPLFILHSKTVQVVWACNVITLQAVGETATKMSKSDTMKPSWWIKITDKIKKMWIISDLAELSHPIRAPL